MTVKALDRPDLDEELVEGVIVNATPHPHDPVGQTESLKDFGVLDDTQAQIHAGKIQGALAQIGYQIRRSDIDTGPTVSVGECTISVIDHAE